MNWIPVSEAIKFLSWLDVCAGYLVNVTSEVQGICKWDNQKQMTTGKSL